MSPDTFLWIVLTLIVAGFAVACLVSFGALDRRFERQRADVSLSLKKSKEVREEMAAPPEDTPQRRMVLGKAREMQAIRASSGAELVSADLLAMTSAERKRAYREFEREFARRSRPRWLAFLYRVFGGSR